MVTTLKICKSFWAMKICNLAFSYAMFTFLFWKKKAKFPKFSLIDQIIPCLVSHLFLSQLWVHKGKILFCLLAENQGVSGHECPTLRGKPCSHFQLSLMRLYLWEVVAVRPCQLVCYWNSLNPFMEVVGDWGMLWGCTDWGCNLRMWP